SQVSPLPVRVVKSAVSEYEIERIADWKQSTNNRNVRFLVQWKGYPEEESTWEP
ncbi:hypothetical protein K440DRAFT_507647, partial [Wilcoxina mikolae CBS 423.85]